MFPVVQAHTDTTPMPGFFRFLTLLALRMFINEKVSFTMALPKYEFPESDIVLPMVSYTASHLSLRVIFSFVFDCLALDECFR